MTTDDKKSIEELKKEAAKAAKEAALKKLEEKKALTDKEVGQDLISQPVASVDKKEETPVEDEKTKALELAKAKAAAAAKAKAAALAKQKEKEVSTEPNVEDEKAKALELAKAKAAAAAKAKAAALAKQEGNTEAGTDDEKAKAIAKAKAVAVAKAKAAALAKEKGQSGSSTDDEKAKAIAIAKAKAAAAAKAKSKPDTVVEQPAEPSINQPYLDKYVTIIKEHVGEDSLEDFYINRLSKDVPTLVINSDSYYKVCEFLKYNEQLAFHYLANLHATDYMTHFEVYIHLHSYDNKQSVAVKVKVDRENAVLDSVTPIWQGANWPEREVYDLLGITFTNHPDMKRILLSDDWVGHPLRKDYEPYDVEV